MKPILLIPLVLLTAALQFSQSPKPHKMTAEAVGARSGTSRELVEVMYCLKAGDLDWLADSQALDRAKRLRVGITHDRRTYPGKDVIFVVVLENSTGGDVFEVRRRSDRRHRGYMIENNGSFKLGQHGFEWRNEILGGIWTHEYVERNVRKIIRGPKTWISVSSVLLPIRDVSCNSYVTANKPASRSPERVP